MAFFPSFLQSQLIQLVKWRPTLVCFGALSQRFLCIFLLGQLIVMYYKVEGHGELFTVVLAGVLGAFVSMGLLVVNERTFDFGLKAAHRNFTEDFMKIPQIKEFARTVNFSLFGFG